MTENIGYELEKCAVTIAGIVPSVSAEIARLAMDVRRMQRTLDELCAEAQEEAAGEAYVAALNRAKAAGVLVELRAARPVFVGFGS